MAKVYSEYIDTDISGLIVNLQHNLNTLPFITFIRSIAGPKQVATSLFDPVFTEIEHISNNEIKITFASLFKGHFKALAGDETDVKSEILDIKEDINFLYERMNAFTTNGQFDQINTLRDAQHTDLTARIDELSVNLTSLENRVDNL